MIIRLTLVLAAGIAGSMMLFGTDGPEGAKAPIVESVLQPQVKAAVSAPAPAPKPVAASFSVTKPAPVVQPEPVAKPKPVAVASTKPVVAAAPKPPAAKPPAKVEVEVTKQSTLSLSTVSPPAEVLYVTGSLVNLRSGPSTSNPVVAKLGRGAETELLQIVGDGWMQIRDSATGLTGYMSGDFLSAEAPR